MAENGDQEIREFLTSRLKSLRDLHSKGILSKRLLGRQLVKLVCSDKAKQIYRNMSDKEKEARRLLMRMDDPALWREDSARSEDERRKLFPNRLVDILADNQESAVEKVLELLMDTANLPFFAGFVWEDDDDPPKRESRVSVLD